MEEPGYMICIRGNKRNLIASETNVKDPESKAWEAMIAANAEKPTPKRSNRGKAWKKGLGFQSVDRQDLDKPLITKQLDLSN